MQFERFTALVALAVLMTLGLSAAVAAGQSAEGYAGAHVSFETSENAVEDYRVDGAAMFDRAAVQSVENTRNRGGSGMGLGVGAGGRVDLSAVSGIAGARVSGVARARTSANVAFDGSARMEAHDNPNGVVVLGAGGEEQLVEVSVPANARAETESDVIVSTRRDGVEGSFIVVGRGNASVNDDGNVTAHLGERSRLVFRAHTRGADRDDRRQERMIANEHVAAELQFTGESDRVDGAAYLRNTQAEGRQMSGDRVEVTVDRGSSEGKIVMVTVSEAAVGRSAAFDVDVDGEAATEVESYGDLRSALGGDAPAYKVVGETNASSHAQVLVALDHFSERTIQITEHDTSDDGTDDGSMDGDGDGSTDDGSSDDGQGLPGFTPIAAVLAVAGVALLALRRRR